MLAPCRPHSVQKARDAIPCLLATTKRPIYRELSQFRTSFSWRNGGNRTAKFDSSFTPDLEVTSTSPDGQRPVKRAYGAGHPTKEWNMLRNLMRAAVLCAALCALGAVSASSAF